MSYFIGIDLGTTTVKVAAFNENLDMVAMNSLEVPVITCLDGSIRQDTANWYELPCQLIKEMGQKIPLSEVKALSVSSQGISFAPVDDEFKPLCKAVCWLDSTAEKEMVEIVDTVGKEELFKLTGKHPNSQYSLPKILKFKKEHKEIFDAAKKILMPLDYVNARFTGNAVTDITMASGTMLFNILQLCWDKNICDTFGIDRSKLPDVGQGGAFVGYINKETSLLSGLREDTAVVLGAQDQKIAAYGASLTPGVPTLCLGTAGALEFLADKPVNSDFSVFPYFNGKYVLEGCINTAGAGIKWFRDTFCGELSYAEMDKLAEKAAPGCHGVVFGPNFSGRGTPNVDNDEKAYITNITLGTRLSDIIRALYEGIGREIKNNVDAIRKHGIEVNHLNMFGGGSKSTIMKEIFEDVANINITRLDNPEMSLEGAAKLSLEYYLSVE